MRSILSVQILALSFWITPAFSSDEIVISYDQVVQKVSNENYHVLENALRVYQAKQEIQVARGNLLPKLNIWKLVNLTYDPRAWLGLIQDIAPFLVPANWFKVQEQKLLHEAQKQAYRALWANELMTAKALYVHALLDQSLLEHLTQSDQALKSILEIVRAKELLGEIREGPSKEIEIGLLALKEDRRSLEVVIQADKSLLVTMIGAPGNTDIRLEPVPVPQFEMQVPVRYEQFEERTLQFSPELTQLDFLIEAAQYMKKEQIFSFLGTSSEGLGFGTAPSIKISKAQREILKLQRESLREALRRQLKLLVENYNLDLEHHENLKVRRELTRGILVSLYERLMLGELIPPDELVAASKNHIQAEAAFFSVQYRFTTTLDKLDRLLFRGDYEKEKS